MSTELVKQETAVVFNPEQTIQRGQEAAKALMGMLESKKDKVTINGKMYLEFSDWLALSTFFGYSVMVTHTEPCEYEGAKGWEATADVINSNLLGPDGKPVVLSRADAMCLNSERNWRGKDNFAVRSMAQTRASAKALRAVLGWIPKLSGADISDTPREEMDFQVVKAKTGRINNAKPTSKEEATVAEYATLHEAHPEVVKKHSVVAGKELTLEEVKKIKTDKGLKWIESVVQKVKEEVNG